jgi:hypothetical protein
MADLTPADRLEQHLCRQFVSSYISRALGSRKAVKIDPHRIYMAARFHGLKVSTNTLNKVIQEMLT